jgi:hypothetical protein
VWQCHGQSSLERGKAGFGGPNLMCFAPTGQREVGNSPRGFSSGSDHRNEAPDVRRLAPSFDIFGGEFQGSAEIGKTSGARQVDGHCCIGSA